MGKTRNGTFVSPKGKPSGEGTGTGLKDAFAVNDLEKDKELADKYMEAPDEPAGNVVMRHPNRNVEKGREGDADKA